MASNTHGAGFALVSPEPVGQNDHWDGWLTHVQRWHRVHRQNSRNREPRRCTCRTGRWSCVLASRASSPVWVWARRLRRMSPRSVILLVIRFGPQPGALEFLPDTPSEEIVWLAVAGPGGGGGGGGNKMPEPPRKAEVPGKEKITVPVKETPKPTPEPPKPEPPPEQLVIPAQTMASAVVEARARSSRMRRSPNRKARARKAAPAREQGRALVPVRARASDRNRRRHGRRRVSPWRRNYAPGCSVRTQARLHRRRDAREGAGLGMARVHRDAGRQCR